MAVLNLSNKHMGRSKCFTTLSNILWAQGKGPVTRFATGCPKLP